MECIIEFNSAKKALGRLSQRTSGNAQHNAEKTVNEILNKVQKEGDNALIHYTKLFDGYCPDPLEISKEELLKAWENIPKNLQAALELAHKRIEKFHQYQKPKDISIRGEYGEFLGKRWRAVEKAGIYIPGGRASYPSTVLMNAIPAKVAGVKNILMVSPANKNGKINNVVLAAAHLSGITKVIRVGGAQAIAALAFGTESVPKVDVISGPGNIYVTLAKKAVYGKVGIDSLAGPSEVLIIADHTAKVKQIASDLLAQAEHDPLAAAILITTEKNLANEVKKEINIQLNNHPRESICRSSLDNWGLIITCKNLEECIILSDHFAPEHLELLIEKPGEVAEKINHAGAIFLGHLTPEAVGDYLAGPNHTLPTSGTARHSGALGVETFMKNTSLIEFNKKSFQKTSEAIKELATSEGLYSHAESIKNRL